jgi:small conductance mechanosensitive channel
VPTPGFGGGNTTVRRISRRLITIRLSYLTRIGTSWLLLFVILIVTTITIPNSVGAQDERVTVRLDGRAVFRVSAVDNTNVSERAKQIERRMNRLLENPTAISPLRIETSKNNQERIITSA